jgi:mRNA interferase MazF
MPIHFYPKVGTLLICDFTSGFKPPEIVKKRPVVVISKARQQLVTVVPISTTEPKPLRAWHHEMNPASFPEILRKRGRHWAKCDIIMTVGFDRLDRIKIGKDPLTGKRIYIDYLITTEDFKAIRKAVLHALGLSFS